MKSKSLRFFFIVSGVSFLFLFNHALGKTEREILTIYSYESFVSKWGPGPSIKQEFEKHCNCEIKWINADDGAAILTRMKLEGKNNKADLVIGLDTNLIEDAKATGFFEAYSPKNYSKLSLPVKVDLSNTFIPFDYGWFAFMVNTEKIKNPPKTFKELLESPKYKKSLLIQDPTISTPGLGLLLWIKSVYGKDSPAMLKKLAAQTLTVTKGWSDAYGLFTKGEAPFVLSYTTSEAYHLLEESSSKYKALIFPEGHYAQIEVAAMVATSLKKPLAKQFLDFIFDNSFQRSVALKNWMYPVVDMGKLVTIPKEFTSLPKPKQTFLFSPLEVHNNKKQWIQEWQAAFQ